MYWQQRLPHGCHLFRGKGEGGKETLIIAYGITWPESEEEEETFVIAMNFAPSVVSVPSLGGGTSK
jgi:hypothetical protein